MQRSTLAQYLQPHYLVGAVAVIGIITVALVFAFSGGKPAAAYVHPTTGPVSQTVRASGTVKPAESIDLSFQLGGRIAYAGPQVGARVGAGTTLATLSSADLAASVAQAKAALAMQQARLESLQAGARAEDVAVAQTAVQGAESTLAQAKQSVLAAAQDAYIKSDDAIHNKVDQFFTNPRSFQPTLNLTLSNSQLQTNIESGRAAIEQLLATWQTSINALPDDANALDVAALSAQTKTNLTQVSSYLDTVAAGLTQVVYTTSYTQATVQGYQSAVATGRAAVSGDITALNAALSTEKAAEASLASSKSQLTLKQAPASATDIAAQEAQVASAQASVDAAQAQLGKSVISAPIAGTVTRNDAHVGATAAPGVTLITLNSSSAFQIEVFVSEADIAYVKTGQNAAVTLDAYGDSTPFNAHVVSVDPAATVQNGVSSYKVTLAFDSNDGRVQAGMTGNVSITVASKDDALLVPSSALIARGGSSYVLRKSGAADELVAVQIGVAGQTETEILSGLTANDLIRSFGGQ
jgi:RND family efflux transporter MFP subunit